MTSHKDRITSLAFSLDGKRLATGSHDTTVTVWDTATGQELFALYGHRSDVLAVAFSSDGKRLTTASLDGTVQVYSLDAAELLGLGRRLATRRPMSLTPDECQKYFHTAPCPALP